MHETQLSSRKTGSLPVKQFKQYAEGWLLDCEMRQHSKKMLILRRYIIDKFLWWCQYAEIPDVTSLTLRQFLLYVTNGHKELGGRWGNPRETEAVKPATVQMYHRHLRACLNWIVVEGGCEASPLATVKAPIDRPDQIQPFTEQQVNAILDAARRSSHPARDEAICLFLLDTAVRVSEMCGMCMGDLDMITRSATVEGKGGKRRQVNFGSRTAKAMWKYLKEGQERTQDAPVFRADKGTRAGQALTSNGILQMLNRLEKLSGVQGVRVSPHTFRHTCAVMFLRAGGNQFTLMAMLGHTDTKMTMRYVNFAQADVANQHRQFSPVERLSRKK